jgi:hypothetical protein
MFGFKSRRPLGNPKLTPATRKERSSRAHKYKSWIKDDWRKVRHFHTQKRKLKKNEVSG